MSIGFDSLRLHRTAIWGFGREGQAALTAIRRYYPEKKLALLISADEAEHWDFSHDANLEVVTADVTAGILGQYGTVIKSPGISAYSNAIDWAKFRGTRFVSGTALWFGEHANSKTIAITGTKGKSTVSALTAFLLRHAGQLTALCGNIGMPLLELLHPDPEPDWWVIELSSYQTADFWGTPAIACCLNLFPEHLPWHGSEERYYADKLKIFAEGRCDVGIINGADDRLVAMTKFVERGYYYNSFDSWHVSDTHICYAREPVLSLKDLRLQGRHNAENVCAALTIVQAAGFDAKQLAAHVPHFRPLPHRLQQLGARAGLEFVDDSISTTPHATIAALNSLEASAIAKTTVLVGGFDRGLSYEDFVDYLQAKPPHAVIVMGANGDQIEAAIRARIPTVVPNADHKANPGQIGLKRVDTLDEACELALQVTPRGGTVLLSPGAASFDQFKSYAERGIAFAHACGFGDAADSSISGLGIA